LEVIFFLQIIYVRRSKSAAAAEFASRRRIGLREWSFVINNRNDRPLTEAPKNRRMSAKR